jgi:hypothetical protein
MAAVDLDEAHFGDQREEEQGDLAAMERSELERLAAQLRKRVKELEVELAEVKEDNRVLRAQAKPPPGLPFHIDTDPAGKKQEQDEEEEEETSSAGDQLEIVYLAAMDTVLEKKDEKASKEEEEEEEGASSPPPALARGNSCFNCRGDHMLVDCPEPRDGRAIARNRRERAAAAGPASSSARYHLDEPQRFGHIMPGTELSRRLRNALDLRSNQLPSYVYRMRQLGYPPGWLKEAEIRDSGVALYLTGEQSAHVKSEEGEVDQNEQKDEECQYDYDKLVAWPGFNAPPPADFRDDSRYYRCPPWQPDQSLEAMAKQFNCRQVRTGYVQGEMEDTNTAPLTPPDSQSKEEPTGQLDTPKEDTPEPMLAGLLSEEVKEVAQGTPIVAMHSPYTELPAQNSWAAGTTDHICFENLPDSTGKWDQMREVLKRGRQLKEKMAAEAL